MPPKKKSSAIKSAMKSMKSPKLMNFGAGNSIPIIIAYSISVFLMYSSYQYLVNLENCDCFEKNKVDLKFLQYYEMIAAVLGVFIILFNVILKVFGGGGKQTGGSSLENIRKSGFLKVGNLIILLAMMVLHFFIASNAYNIYKEVVNDCKCSNQWEQYYIYLQGGGSLLFLASVATRIFFLLIALLITI